MESIYSNYKNAVKKIGKEIAPLQEKIDQLNMKKSYELRSLQESMEKMRSTIDTDYPALTSYLSQRLSNFPELYNCDFFKKQKKDDWTIKDYLFFVLFLSDWGRLSIPFPKTKDKIFEKEIKKFFIDLGYKVSFSDTKRFGLTVWTYRFYYGDKNQNYIVFILQ